MPLLAFKYKKSLLVLFSILLFSITTFLSPAAHSNVTVEQIKNTPLSFPAIDTSMQTRLLDYVHKTVLTHHYTAYKLGGTHYDINRGIYIVDCSIYIDHILKAVYPHAFRSLVRSAGSGSPTSQHYYHFFNQLNSQPRTYWNKIDDVKQLRPGDILVFRFRKPTHVNTEGHVMVVMNKPVGHTNTFVVRVSDSSPFRHSRDTRVIHSTGIGIGTMLLKVNPHTGQPNAYAWSLDGRWKNNVHFAMARPMDIY
jgi:hypothetical protein